MLNTLLFWTAGDDCVLPHMQGYKQKRGFIIAQAPMSNTAGDFWKMVYEREVAVIVMLSEFYEDDKVKTSWEHCLLEPINWQRWNWGQKRGE